MNALLALTLALGGAAGFSLNAPVPSSALTRARASSQHFAMVETESKPAFKLPWQKDDTEGSVKPTGGAEAEEELSESKKLMQQVKDAGVAGIISYIFWEWAFWGVSIPVCISAYYGVTGHFPDFGDADDRAKLGAEAFAFVNVARFAVPLRIGLALGTTPWVKENVVDKFGLDKNKE